MMLPITVGQTINRDEVAARSDAYCRNYGFVREQLPDGEFPWPVTCDGRG